MIFIMPPKVLDLLDQFHKGDGWDSPIMGMDRDTLWRSFKPYLFITFT